MEKLETLLKLDTGNFDTPKKLNRSDKPIPRSFVDQIEAAEIKSEMLETIQRSGFPVFRYKTCLTIHGLFDLEKLPRIGGYKNLIQNQNGSLEIRYNAIDFGRKKRIMKALHAASDFTGHIDSRGFSLSMTKSIHNRTEYAEQLAQFQPTLDRIKKINFYGKASIWLGKTLWGGYILVLEVILDAIKEPDVHPFILAASGLDAGSLHDKLMQKQAEDEAREAEYKRTSEIDKARRAEAEIRRSELEKQLSVNGKMVMAVGSLGAKAIALGDQVGFQAIRITKKGSFGRFGFEFTRVPTLDALTGARWQPARTQKKPDEIGSYFAV